MIAQERDNMTVRDFFEKVYRRRRLLNASAKSVAQVVFAINRFDDFLDRPAMLADLTLDTLCDWMAWQVGDELSPSTINGRIKLLATLWRFAAKMKYPVSGDDPADIELLKRPRRLAVAWTIDEFERLLVACRKTDGRIVGIPAGAFWESLLCLLFDTGLRRSAALAIRIDEIDLTTHVLRVPAERMKNRCEQIFWLSDRTMAAVTATIPPARSLLFPWPWKCPATLDRRLRDILDKADLPTGRRDLFHKLRRTCASHIAAAAGEAVAIKQLGHSDASCIGRYVDPRFTSSHEAAKLLARPGWDGRRLVVEVKPDVDSDSLPPRIVRLSRSDWQGEGLGVLAPLAKPEGFTGEDLAKVIEHLGIHVKDFAELLGTDRRNLGAIVRGKKAKIGVALRQKIRSALGMNFVFEGQTANATVEGSGLTPQPALVAALRRDGVERKSAARKGGAA